MAVQKPETYSVKVYDNSGGTLLASYGEFQSSAQVALLYLAKGTKYDDLTASVDGLYATQNGGAYSLVLDMTNYAGLSRTPNATTPTILIGDEIASADGITFYVVDKATTAPPPSFSDVEVTPHEGYITMTINGVDFNLKTAASVSLISFSVSSNVTATYQAEDGMTWAEWVASDYNTDGFVVDSGRIFMAGSPVAYGSGTYVSPSDTIQSGYSYVLGGGGAN